MLAAFHFQVGTHISTVEPIIVKVIGVDGDSDLLRSESVGAVLADKLIQCVIREYSNLQSSNSLKDSLKLV